MKKSLLAAALLSLALPSLGLAQKATATRYLTPINPQLEVEVQPPALGWFLGADFDSPRETPSPAKYAGIKDLVGDYPFAERLEAALRARLPNSGLATRPNFTVERDWLKLLLARRSHGPQILEVVPLWDFDKNGSQLVSDLRVKLIERMTLPSGESDTDSYFEGHYIAHIVLPTKAGEAANLDAWKAMGKEKLYRVLDESIAQSVDMLVFDFSSEGRATWDKAPKVPGIVDGVKYGSRQVKGTDRWTWISDGGDDEHELNGYMPVTRIDFNAPSPISQATR